MKINQQCKEAMCVVVRIDQGDYLQERGGYDWGRANKGDATEYDTTDAAIAAIERLQVSGIAREIEPALDSI